MNPDPPSPASDSKNVTTSVVETASADPVMLHRPAKMMVNDLSHSPGTIHAR
jgi:hypothetical protein